MILKKLEEDGYEALEVLDTRQIRGKLWEIKFYDDNRILYLVTDGDNMYLVHAFRKQKNKSEKFEIDKATRRIKELGKEIMKILI